MLNQPETVSWLRVVMASGVVLGLLGLLLIGLRYIAAKGIILPGKKNAMRRLGVVDSLALDTKRRLVIVRCDEREHLLLLGINQDIVIASNFPSSLPPTSDSTSTSP